MAIAGDVDFTIEKVIVENYHNWTFQIKMYLIGKDLWKIVTGTEVLAEGASAQEQRIIIIIHSLYRVIQSATIS